MRKIKIIEHVSIDGVIQAGGDTDGGFQYGDWSAAYRSPEGLAYMMQEHWQNFDLLLGRKTFDLWMTFWPTAQGPMAERLKNATKYVVTHRPHSLQEWGPVKGISGGDFVKAIGDLKSTSGAVLIVAGSSSLTSLLLEHGLVDDVVLLVNPVLLGGGKKILADKTPARSLTLVSSKALPTGVIVNVYRTPAPLKNLS